MREGEGERARGREGGREGGREEEERWKESFWKTIVRKHAAMATIKMPILRIHSVLLSMRK